MTDAPRKPLAPGGPPRSPARPAANKQSLWLGSFVTLGAVDVASGASVRLLTRLRTLGIAGGAGLVAVSTHDLRSHVDPYQKIDAASDLAWGVQGLLYLSESASAQAVSIALGFAGAAAQSVAGVLRIRRGRLAARSAEVKLGLLDLGGGLLWLAWDVIGWSQPVFVGTYMLLVVGREAYANKDAVASLTGTLAAETGRSITDVAAAAGVACREVVDLAHRVRALAARVRRATGSRRRPRSPARRPGRARRGSGPGRRAGRPRSTPSSSSRRWDRRADR